MTIDHIGAVFFPGVVMLRVFGRLALPVFVYGLTQGFFHTSNWKKYFFRLTVFGLAAQIPFVLYFEKLQLNILLLLAASLLVLRLLQLRYWWLFVPALALALFAPFEYGIYGIGMAVIYYVFRDRRMMAMLLLTALTAAYTVYIGWIWQAFAVFGFVLALFYKGKIFDYRFGRWFFYIYYPAHLVVLLVVKGLLA